MSDADIPLRRLIIAVDVHRYSRRDPLAQVDTQKDLIDALENAAVAVGLDRRKWHLQSIGDGELAILPAAVDEPVVVADFVEELRKRLLRQNRSLRRDARLRIRVAIHSGMLHLAANGYAGPGPVETCRLLDAAPLKDALAAADEADLVLIVSDSLFRDIVKPGFRGLRPEHFRPVRVTVKEFNRTGYVTVPGHGLPPTADDPPPADSPPTDPPPPSDVPPEWPTGHRAYGQPHTQINVTSHGSGPAFGGHQYNLGGSGDG
ncbi:MAG TPA: hypothetical protein VH912_11730 [Streptosporangiaceae bacterium]